MDTDTVSLQLPGSLREFVEQQVELGGYGNAGEYILSLIRADQRRKVKETLEAEILKGLQSGEASPMTEDDWKSIREEVVKHCIRKTEER